MASSEYCSHRRREADVRVPRIHVLGLEAVPLGGPRHLQALLYQFNPVLLDPIRQMQSVVDPQTNQYGAD